MGACLLQLGAATQAAAVVKAAAGTDLAQGTAWTGGTAPASADIAVWLNGSLGGALTVGGTVSWNGILLTAATSDPSITGSALTLGSGGIDMAVSANNLTIANPIVLASSQIWDVNAGKTLTSSGVISGPSMALTKAGSGALVLNANNSFSGGFSITAGTLKINNAGCLGTGRLSIDGPCFLQAGSGSLTLGSSSQSWNADFRVGYSGGGSTLGTGLGTVALDGNRAVCVDQNAAITVGGVLADGGHSGSLTKTGVGTLTFGASAANTYTGPTTVRMGTLVLNYTSDASKLPDGAALILGGGGTISLTSTIGHTEVVGSTTLEAGGAAIVRSSGTSVLCMRAITRDTGATISLGAAGIAHTDTRNVNGILGGFATVGSAEWAVNSTDGEDGSINALSSYLPLPGTGAVGTANYSSGNLSLSSSGFANSLKLTSGTTLALGAHRLTISSGGLLSVGSSASAITGSASPGLVGGDNGSGNFELIVQQYNSASSGLNISASIGNNGANPTTLTKAGPRTLTLSGANSYTGNTYINEGTLVLKSTGAIANSPNIYLSGTATLDVSGLSSGLNLGANQSLHIGGNGGAMGLATAGGKGVSFTAGGGGLKFDNYVGYGAINPNNIAVPLAVWGGGSLILASDTPVTVHVSNSGFRLAPANRVYKLVSGTVTGTAPSPVAITGDGVDGAASLEIYGGELYLNVVSTVAVAEDTASHLNVGCAGAGGRIVMNEATGGVAPYTYSKDCGTYQSSRAFNDLPAGTYPMTARDSLGALSTAVNITITDPAPVATSAISGDSAVAIGQAGKVYSVSLTSGSSYAWTVPGDATITAGTAGPNNNQITVTFGSMSGNVTVTETSVAGCVGSPVLLAVAVGPNHAPQAKNISMGAQSGIKQTLRIIGSPKYAPQDDDPDTLVLSHCGYSSANGATVGINGDCVEYTSAPAYVGLDSFTYTVSDGQGGTAVGIVSVNVTPVACQSPTVTVSAEGVVLGFWGVPGSSYTVQRATSVDGPWEALGSPVMASTTQPYGQIRFTDRDPPEGEAYYRLQP